MFILWCWYPAKLLYELLTIDQDSLGCKGWGCSYAVGWLGLVMLVTSSIFIMIGTVLVGLEWKNKTWRIILGLATFTSSIPLLLFFILIIWANTFK
ncbi:hypothetical protein Chro_4233 [Chroococcidiopsis thermalis PCC 7203]|uniref:Transmembrane protein n=1 Tax=Chroococcidiopsis thermalis (strain PCC 7203) TaxID=251229 RepID=K9U5V0_CHRTP|nr:hypothetical protein Chro_4233 [Chroococcidiopsis thermalis PCC 7203]